MVMLANGAWFTVNHTFLRITHSTGYTTDYLYAVDESGTFYHDSYQAYERADFRMFKLKSNSDTFPESCGSHCNQEIPKGEGPSMYANMDNGYSTFVPAPCPADGSRAESLSRIPAHSTIFTQSFIVVRSTVAKVASRQRNHRRIIRQDKFSWPHHHAMFCCLPVGSQRSSTPFWPGWFYLPRQVCSPRGLRRRVSHLRCRRRRHDPVLGK